MDPELVRYVIRYFSHLMTKDESLALTYQMGMSKLGHPNEYESIDHYERMKNRLIKLGIINVDKEIIKLLDTGVEEFKLNVAKRIMKENSKDLFFNRCPKCNFIARTPLAKQCRKCKHDWHDE